MLYIGNHTTSSKGYEKMAQQMIANGGNTFAFFTRNPRGGNAKAIDETDVKNFFTCRGQWIWKNRGSCALYYELLRS